MKIIFKQHSKIIKEINIEFENIDQIIFGTSKIKEISFIHEIKNNNKTLEKLYYDFQSFSYLDITDIYFYFNDDNYFIFHNKIKDIYYRILNYNRLGKIENQENLSIRFEQDNQFIEDKDAIYCNTNCQYYKNDYCTKYNQKIKNIVCEPCFLEILPNLKNHYYHQQFQYMRNKYD